MDLVAEGTPSTDGNGEASRHYKVEKKIPEDPSHSNICPEKGLADKDKHGPSEWENGAHHPKPNAKTGSAKRRRGTTYRSAISLLPHPQ